MKGFFITRLAGSNPSWWSGMTPEDWAQMGSTTLAVSEDRKWCVCMVVGTAAQVAKVAALADTLPVGIKGKLDELVPTTTRNKVNTYLTNNSMAFQFDATTTAREMLRRIAKYFDVRFPGAKDEDLPGMAGDPDEVQEVIPK